MDREQIKFFLDSYTPKQSRTIAIVDYGNVEKWRKSLGWIVGIKELAQLVKHFSTGRQPLRRFYYGADYGQSEKSQLLTPWSKMIFEKARMNRFEIIDKRVKYIHNSDNVSGFDKKCDLDVEMIVDLIKEKNNYDNIVLFSGDGDLMYGIAYLHDEHKKSCIVFGARDHVGREVFDAKASGKISDIFYAEDFEYRLRMNRQSRR